MSWTEDIKKRTEDVPVSSGRSKKKGKVSFDDLVLVPAQLDKEPVDYHTEEISAETVVGKNSKDPLELDIPVIIGAMSFGALSKEAKVALGKASSIAGTADNTGEGGLLPGEREAADNLIVQYSTGRFGVDEDYLKSGDAVEIKIGQGAKSGRGGLLPGDKVTEEIAKVRKVEQGKDIHSPASHPDIDSIDQLKERIEEIRNITDGKPIILKLGACTERDVELAVEANPDVIAMDGLEGGTGASPEAMLDDVGIPTLASLTRARKALDDLDADQELWIGGGLNKGADIAKALALGADAVFLAFPLLVAMGCTYCRQCYRGKCPVGITTQDPELRKNFDVEEGAKKAASFMESITEEVKMMAGAVGHSNVHDLERDDVRALTSDMSKITDVKLV